MTPADLDAACRALFGENYSAAQLGSAVGINERNARYWLTGERAPRNPDAVRAALVALLVERGSQVQTTLRRLRGK